MDYTEYIRYHNRGDASVEGRTLAKICRRLGCSDWDKFRLIYYYTMTYNIDSALRLLTQKDVAQSELSFRTDRRYVRCNGAYDRLLSELSAQKLSDLRKCKSTQECYNVVTDWFFFGRYAAFLFLEVYACCFSPAWIDNITFGWEPEENYTRGAELVAGTKDREALDRFLERAKKDTNSNAFAIETSLCAVAKFQKGTRWDGYYTERMLQEADKSKFKSLIYTCL